MIRDDFIVESKVEVDFEEEGGNTFSGDRLLGRAENYPLCKAMVDHDQQTVKAGREREVSDQVARDLLEGARCARLDWGEWWDSRMGV